MYCSTLLTSSSRNQFFFHRRRFFPHRRFSSSVLGIATGDLGTQKTIIATREESKQPRILENLQGEPTTLSFVSIQENGPTKRQSVQNHKNTFLCVKRLIGRKYNASVLKRNRGLFPCTMIPGPNGKTWVQDGFGVNYSPSQISAMILSKMKDTTETRIESKVTKAVISVPGYSNRAQRQATKDAGTIAGSDVLATKQQNKHEDKIIAIYDLGSGTFNISILKLSNNVFEVKAISGDTSLGGEDFNNALSLYFMEEFKKKGVSLKNDPFAQQRLREAVERVKHELSTRLKTQLKFTIQTSDDRHKQLKIPITREKFESRTQDLINKILDRCETCFQLAGVEKEEIDRVILVGGATKMPKVREAVKAFFGKEIEEGKEEDEGLIAMGAAIQAQILMNESKDTVVSPQRIGEPTDFEVFQGNHHWEEGDTLDEGNFKLSGERSVPVGLSEEEVVKMKSQLHVKQSSQSRKKARFMQNFGRFAILWERTTNGASRVHKNISSLYTRMFDQ